MSAGHDDSAPLAGTQGPSGVTTTAVHGSHTVHCSGVVTPCSARQSNRALQWSSDTVQYTAVTPCSAVE